MNKKIVYVFIGIVLLGAIIYFVSGQKFEQSTYNNTPLSTNNQQNNSVETVNWKVYRYDRYNFQILYPPDWTPGISTTFEEGALGFNSPKDSQGNFMNFGVQRYDLGSSGFGYPPETLTAPNTTIGGVKAYKDEGYVRNPDGPSTQSIWLKKDNFIYNLTFQVFKKYNLPSQYKYEDIKPAKFTPEEEKIRDSFISTFQFIK